MPTDAGLGPVGVVQPTSAQRHAIPSAPQHQQATSASSQNTSHGAQLTSGALISVEATLSIPSLTSSDSGEARGAEPVRVVRNSRDRFVHRASGVAAFTIRRG